MSSQNQASEKRRLLCYEVGSESFCLEMAAVRQIEGTELIQPNHAGPSPAGWLPGPQALIPVFSSSDQPRQMAGQSFPDGRVLVLGNSAGDFGLIVDHVTGMIEVAEEQILPVPSVLAGPLHHLLKGIVRIGERWVLYTDPMQLNPETATISARPQVLSAAPAVSHLPIPETTGSLKRADGRSHLMLFSTPGADPREWPVIFGLSVTQVLELMESPEIIPAPSAPDFVSGLVNWREYPVPVIDLNMRLAREQRAQVLTQDCRILIVRALNHEHLAGILIQSETRVQPLPIRHGPSRRELPLDRRMVKGVFELADATLIIPDLDVVLDVAVGG